MKFNWRLSVVSVRLFLGYFVVASAGMVASESGTGVIFVIKKAVQDVSHNNGFSAKEKQFLACIPVVYGAVMGCRQEFDRITRERYGDTFDCSVLCGIVNVLERKIQVLGVDVAMPLGASYDIVGEVLATLRQELGTDDMCAAAMSRDPMIQLDTVLEKLVCIENDIFIVDTDVQVVESKLDVCCATLNSKLNVINSTVNAINGTVNNIETKLLVIIGNSIDAIAECCAVGVGGTQQTNSRLEIIENILGDFSFTCNLCSEIGSIDSKTNDLESKVDLILSILMNL